MKRKITIPPKPNSAYIVGQTESIFQGIPVIDDHNKNMDAMWNSHWKIIVQMEITAALQVKFPKIKSSLEVKDGIISFESGLGVTKKDIETFLDGLGKK